MKAKLPVSDSRVLDKGSPIKKNDSVHVPNSHDSSLEIEGDSLKERHITCLPLTSLRPNVIQNYITEPICKGIVIKDEVSRNESVRRGMTSFFRFHLKALVVWLIVWCCCIVQATNYDVFRPPRIIEHPTSLVVPRGNPATLNCAADGSPITKITWFKDGTLVTTSDGDPLSHRLQLPIGSLFFLSIRQSKKDSDAGVYHCVATNNQGRAYSKNATLTIAVIRDEFRMLPQGVSVSSGGRAELKCSPPRGHPPPTISWLRNGHQLDLLEERDRVELSEEGNLIIKDVLQTDEGEYVCIARNDAGQKSSPPAILDVIVAPFWVKAPRDVIGVAGGTVEISCRVGGDPVPTVTWRRVSGRMPVARATVIKEKGLRLSPLHHDDAGVYVCEAVNIAASITGNASIIVHTAPQVIEVPGDLEIEENSAFRLSCGVEGEPAPLIYWTREGSHSILSSRVTPLAANEALVGVLAVHTTKRAARHHSGRYVCGAVNPAGGVMTRVAVRIRPTHLLPPPIISVPPSNQTLPLRGYATFTCRVWGDPRPSVNWRHRGRPIRPTARHKIHEDNTLTIDELSEDDEGLYTCVASSSRGVTEARASLKVLSSMSSSKHFVKALDAEQFSGPPQTPTVLQSNGTAALLEWVPPVRQGGSPIIGYTIEYYSSSGGTWRTAAHSTPQTTYLLSPLNPSQSYGVTIRALNSQGPSEPSGIAEVGGGGPLTIGLPANIVNRLQEARVILQEAKPSSAASAKILWQMKGEASAVEGFYIRLHHVARDIYPSLSFFDDLNEGIVRAESYSTSLSTRGISRNNEYEHSRKMGFDTRDFEKKYNFHISTNRSYKIDAEDANQFPPSFFSNRGNSSVVTVLNAGPGASSYVLRGLHHYRAYTVFLVPYYSTLEGQPSNSRSFLTAEAAPTAPPKDVGVQLTNVTTASVFWSPPPPLDRNGPIISYQIEVLSIDGSVFMSKILNGSVISATIHNLTLGHSYRLSLAAATNAGRGPFCDPVSLHVDPVLLHPMAKSGPSLAALDGDVWVIGLIGAAVFSLLLLAVASLLLWRRHARNKALGHVGVSVHKVDNLNGGDSCLWQDYSGWHLEKCNTAVLGHAHNASNGIETKVINTTGSLNEGEISVPRSMITFYREAAGNSEGPYATTSLLLPQNSSSLQQSVKMVKSDIRSVDTKDKNVLVNGNTGGAVFTDGSTTLRYKGRGLFAAPPLPCLPPPGVPQESRRDTPCYCAALTESAYSEAHYAPTVAIRPPAGYPGSDPPDTVKHEGLPLHYSYQATTCPAHIYATATPLPPYPDSVASRPSQPSPATSHHHLCRNSAVYESASLQYAPAGYFLPTSSSNMSSGQVTPGGERGTPVLPSVTYEALRALSLDIEAFRQRQKLQDELTCNPTPHSKPTNQSKTPSSSKSSGRNTKLNSVDEGDPRDTELPHPEMLNFDLPAPPTSSPPTHERNNPSVPQPKPQAGTLAPGGSLPPIHIDIAPLGEGESDCYTGEDDIDDECSQCSCSCSEAESSVYAETDFADEVRQALQEPGTITVKTHSGRRHVHRKRPVSGCSSDSNYTNVGDIPHIDSLPCRKKSQLSLKKKNRETAIVNSE